MTLAYRDEHVELYHGDALEVLRTFNDRSVDAVVTSPPYLDARIEYPSPTFDEFVNIWRECRRVVVGPMLVNVGRLWRGKEEIPLAHETREAARAAGWPHVETIVWAKLNPNPIQGAVVTNAHEYVLLFGRPEDFDTDAIRSEYRPDSVARLHRPFHYGVKGRQDVAKLDPGSARPHELGARATSVFVCSTGRGGTDHPAPMPLELAEHLVIASGAKVILDPFAGSGTTALAARRRGRYTLLIERDATYVEGARGRLCLPFDPAVPPDRPVQLMLGDVS